MQDVVRFWLDRGVDGFRVDAVNVMVKDAELRDDPPASGEFPLPLTGEAAELDHVYSGNRPEVTDALAALREAAGDALLVGEVYLETAEYPRYLEHLDLVFAFELLHSPWETERLRAAIEPALALGRVAWVLSNHDFPRLASRVGEQRLREAAELLLSLPARRSSTRATRSGSPTGPVPILPSTAPAVTGTATRCSGTRRRTAASPPALPGSRPSTRSAATSRLSAATRPPCWSTTGA